MQDTRLNRILNESGLRIESWFRNPWRRLTGLLIALLIGFLLGNVTSTTAGQSAQYDAWVAVILITIIESINLIAYRGKPFMARSFLIDALNALKIGFVYSFLLDALKLGS
jgi:Protein of unknown function (DUF565)